MSAPESGTPDDDLHAHVLRQLRRTGIESLAEPPSPEQFRALLRMVSHKYAESDRDGYLNDRAWEISSAEMTELYSQLEERSATELASERDRLRTVLNTTTTGLCLIDSQRLIREMNAAAAKYLSVGLGDTYGMAIVDILWGERADEHRLPFPEDLRDAIVANRLWVEDFIQFVDAEGEQCTVSVLYSPVDAFRSGGGVLAIQDHTRQSLAEANLEWRARHDQLTGLLNRAEFSRLVDESLSSGDPGSMSALMFLDLDRFKNVNDTFGHDAGDSVLIEAADRLQRSLSDSDFVCRFGGDEFVIFVGRVAGRVDAQRLATRIIQLLREPFNVFGASMVITASIGMTISEEDITASEMLRDADIALYQAKNAGRDRVSVFGSQLRSNVRERVQMERSLRTAVSRGELTVAYQPLVRAHDLSLFGFEALARWQEGDRIVPPATFIAIAEEAGFIAELGEVVLAHSLELIREFGPPEDAPVLAINVSGLQISRPGFSRRFLRQTDRAGVPGTQLCVELTEQALLTDTAVITELNILKDAGVAVALHDFGTGWSSLSLLQQFPLDRVKVDRSFVQPMITNSQDAAIVAAIIRLCRTLGLEVVAEGVEERGQLDLLRSLGCDLIQGYYTGRPMVADKALRWAEGRAAPSQRVLAADRDVLR